MAGNSWQKLLQDAVTLIRQGQAGRAMPLLQQAQKLAPDVRDVNYWLANACRMTGQTEVAQSLFRKLLAERPDDLDSAFAMAFMLRDLGRPDKVAAVLVRAARFPGRTGEQLLQVAGFLRDVNQAPAAIEVCEMAVEQNPGKADLRFKLARLYQSVGNFDRAREELRRTLDLDPSTGPAWTLLSQQKSFQNMDDMDYKRIREAAGQSLGHEADMCVSFAHAKALDDLGLRPQAWEQYRKGNQQASAFFPWDHLSWSEFVDKAASSAAGILPAASGTGRNAVFIVGMPRSGTTLLEQLLARHPDVQGRGETNFLAHFAQQLTASDAPTATHRQQLADSFWTQLRLNGAEGGYYIDKNPLNFRYLPELFQLLPNAKILHISRDGRDSCLSCYFQLFQHLDTSFSYRHEDLLSFYAGYRHLLAEWEKQHPDRIYRLDYADLVQSSNDVLAEAMDFLGLEWEESLMQASPQDSLVRSASAWQARQDVHAESVARWRGYYDQAPEFFDRLSEIDAQYN